jgi:hypothetical protein
MHLVEPEEVGPIEGDDALVTPPRPPHRRVSVSLLFTLSVLIGTVVTIYLVLPARHNVLVTEAIGYHKDTTDNWELDKPSTVELHAWAIGLVGKDVPLPTDGATIVGARRVVVLNRNAALVRLQIGGEPITYLVQSSRGIAPQKVTQNESGLHAEYWRRGKFNCVVVGPEASAQTWLASFPKH